MFATSDRIGEQCPWIDEPLWVWLASSGLAS
jgi:hypothetical protein